MSDSTIVLFSILLGQRKRERAAHAFAFIDPLRINSNLTGRARTQAALNIFFPESSHAHINMRPLNTHTPFRSIENLCED